ncbi:MAG: hypothetical protein HY672_02830 [Chloroflexi bacterium]|nr:hypothetical protein [Chloroflexota bacterium]
MTLEADGLPVRPFFSCTPKGFVVVDAGNGKKMLGLGSLEPWMVFDGEGGASKVISVGELVCLGELEERREGRGYVAVS